jgi:DNA-binding CsgD family transcriptional regulator
VSLAGEAQVGMRGPEQPSWKQRLDAEIDNMRAAMAHALATGAIEQHLELTSSLLDFWLLRGSFDEIQSSLTDALEASTGSDHVRARALATMGWMSYMTGDLPASWDAAHEAVELARATGDDEALATGLWVWSFSDFFMGRRAADLDEAAEIAERIGADMLLTRILVARGMVRLWGAEPQLGLALLREAMARGEATQDVDSLGWAAYITAVPLSLAGYLDEADALSEVSLRANRATGNVAFVAQTLGVAAWVAAFRRDDEAASALLEDAEEAVSLVDSDYFRREILVFRAVVATVAGDPETAASIVEETLPVWRAAQWHIFTSTTLWILGVAALARGELDAARRHLEECVQVTGLVPYALFGNLFVRDVVRLERAAGDIERAEDVAHATLREALELDAAGGVADGLDLLGGIAADLGSWQEAARLWGASERVQAATGWARFRVHEPRFEADLAAVRSALGDEQLAARWAEGRDMSTEDAVAYAVRGRGERGRSSVGWRSLTPTELAVVARVAQGLTNPAIAERLFMSINTVKTHLRHIFDKLEVSSRAELAAEATVHQVGEER